jgi:hypothetical protein
MRTEANLPIEEVIVTSRAEAEAFVAAVQEKGP